MLKTNTIIKSIIIIICLNDLFAHSQEMYTILNEQFNDNSNNWNLNSTKDCSFEISDGFFYLEHDTTKTSSLSRSFQTLDVNCKTTFRIETLIKKVSGITNYGYGLDFMKLSRCNLDKFLISGGGYFKINNTWTKSDIINKGNGSVNHLSILIDTNELKYFINHKLVYTSDYNCDSCSTIRVRFQVDCNQTIAIDNITVSTGSLAHANFFKAWKFLQINDFRNALDYINRAISLEPNDQMYNIIKAYILTEKGDYSEAINELSRLIELNPTKILYFRRAVAYRDFGEFDDAIKDLTKAIELDKSHRLYSTRAEVYRHVGKFNEALSDYTTAIGLHSNIVNYRDRARLNLWLERYQDAADDYTLAIDLGSRSQQLFRERGYCYNKIGMANAAKSDFTLAIKRSKTNDEIALIKCFANEYKEAIRYANLAVSEEGNARSYDIRATAYGLANEYHKAFEDFDKAIELSPGSSLYVYKRGLVKKAMKDYNGAKQDFIKAKQSDSNEDYLYKIDPLILALSEKNKSNSNLLPPIVVISDISFSKNVLDAEETAILKITLRNAGPGIANNVYVNLTGYLTGLSFPPKTYFPPIAPNGGSDSVTIEFKGNIDLPTSEALINIEVVEPDFKVKIQGKQLKFPTREFQKPELILAQIAAIENQSGNPNSQIDINEIIDIKFAVQNIGQGKAENVTIEVENNQDGVMHLGVLEGNELFRQNPSFSEIQSGKYEIMIYRYFVNSEFNDNQLDFTIKAEERAGKYGLSIIKSFPINKQLVDSGIVRTIYKVDDENQPDVTIEDIPDLAVDVDQNIPTNSFLNNNTFAVVIGNESYTNEMSVMFALNDARIIKQYLRKVLCLPSNNLYYIENATFGQMLDALDWINDVIKAYEGQAKVIFYYAGHGMPDEQTKSAFLLPVDGNSQNSSTAVKLADVYNGLTEYPSASAIVFLDACFSGATRQTDGTMLTHARSVAFKPDEETLTGNLIVFSAVEGNQTALPYPQKQHGIFTYFLLKKLRESNGMASLGELYDYIKLNVTQQSIVVNKKTQTPQVTTSLQVQNTWQEEKLVINQE